MTVHNASLRPFTVEEFHRMRASGVLGVEERLELVEGHLVALPPVDALHHAAVERVARLLREHLGESCLATEDRFRTGDSELRPDLRIITPPGTNHLVVEVATPDSLLYDQEEKASLYARAGFTEYWLLDLAGRRLQVHRKPGRMRRRPWGHGYYEGRFLDAEAAVPLPAPLGIEGAIPVAVFLAGAQA